MRSIIHFRLNSFCAALEQLRKPELAGRPVLVTRKSGRGEFIVSASRECGLSAQLLGQEFNSLPNNWLTVRHALRYCPTAIVLPADWDYYRETSEAVMDILSTYSPLLEPDLLDKAYMDVTGCTKLFGSPKRIALEVQRRVLDEIGVSVSVGIARNKLVAFAASSACESGGYIAVRPGTERKFIAGLPVGSLNGVGTKIEKRLQGLGVRTIGELAAIPERMLIRQFGPLGSSLCAQSQGMDHTPVAALYPPAIVIIERKFGYDEEASEPEVVEAYLLRMCEWLAMQMRKRDQQAGALKLVMEYEGLPIESRFYTFKTPASSVHDIYTGARRLYHQMVNPKENAPLPVDGLGVACAAVCGLRSAVLTLSDLYTGSGIQLSLIGDTERMMRLDSVLEMIRSRFGDRAIACGMA